MHLWEGLGVCSCLKLIYRRVCCAFQEDMDECDCLEEGIDGWVCLYRILECMGLGGCDCSNHIYGLMYLFRIHLWVYLSRRHLWMGVAVWKTFTGECNCLQHIYCWVCLLELMSVCDCMRHFMVGCDWVWVIVTGCGWVGKLIKPVCTSFTWLRIIRQVNKVYYAMSNWFHVKCNPCACEKTIRIEPFYSKIAGQSFLFIIGEERTLLIFFNFKNQLKLRLHLVIYILIVYILVYILIYICNI